MIERRQIVDLWHRGQAAALATLIRVEGSSYRRTGARLLIAADGAYAGSISGGCLEAEVIRKAQWLVRNGATIQRYSTLFDDTAEIPYGLGCGGTVDVLLEPANTPAFTTLMQALEASLHGQSFHITTHLPTSSTPLSRRVTNLGAPDPDLRTREFEPQNLAAHPQTFSETLTPPQRLLLFGAGDDAQPLVSLAALLGWSVLVLDARPRWATPQRFPHAEQVLTLTLSSPAPVTYPSLAFTPHSASEATPHPIAEAPTARLIPAWGNAPGSSESESPRAEGPPHFLATASHDAIAITPQDAVVLMTHSYEQDRHWLTATLPTHPRYLGLLGSRHRSALLIAEAAAALNWSLDRACAGLFAPVGLDLGGDGAESIALAIIAEIQACREGKLGISRRMSPALIAEQLAHGGASRYLQAQCAV